MNHSFNVDLATDLGIEEAILIENLGFWIAKNQANNKNFYDGYYWIYNSASAFSELFPYMTPSKINRSLNKLEEKGIIKSGNYNKVAYDRTKWYTIIDKCICTIYKIHFAKCKMESDDLQNGFTQNATPIPDIITDIKTNINTDNKDILSGNPTPPFKEIIDYLNLKANTKYKHNTPKTQTLIKSRFNEGFNLEDFKTVIDNKANQWINDTTWSSYLRPETLFGTKFESYLNEKVKTDSDNSRKDSIKEFGF